MMLFVASNREISSPRARSRPMTTSQCGTHAMAAGVADRLSSIEEPVGTVEEIHA